MSAQYPAHCGECGVALADVYEASFHFAYSHKPTVSEEDHA